MANAAGTKRFMAPSGGPVAGPSSLSSQDPAMHNTTTSFARSGTSSNTRISRSYVGQRHQVQHFAHSSRYLVTVLPPEHLPHDPPHPRTSTFCSGYGPPSKFRRGTLVPLHPTLAGQMAAIAREYGLPSTGGLALYLVELSQGQPSSLSNALVGGPRIGDEAWQLLWGQLFTPPQDDYDNSLSEEEEPYFEEYPIEQQNASIPDMPPLPPSMKASQRQYGPQESSTLHQTGVIRPSSPGEPQSDASSLADNSSALASEDLLGHHSIVSSNTSHVFSPASLSMRQTKSANTSHNHRLTESIPSSPPARPHSSASRGRPRNLARTQSRRPSSSVNRPSSSRHSVRSNRSYSQSNTSAEGPLYGEAVVVGKIEFDIDNRRGAGKWFDVWVQSATADSSGSSSPLQAQHRIESGSLLSGHQPSHSQSILRDRHLISQLESQNSVKPGSAAAADSVELQQPSPKQRTPHLDAAGGADVVLPLQDPRAQSSDRDSIMSSASPANSANLPAGGMLEKLETQQPILGGAQPEYTFNLENADSRAPAASSTVDDSKRSSIASQFSMLSPVQVSASQRSSQDIAGWQSDLSKSFDESLQPASERSSSSSFGHEANIEAMNATPRVRTSSTFAKRSPTLSPSPARSARTHTRLNSDASAPSNTSQTSELDTDNEVAAVEVSTIPFRHPTYSEDGDSQSRRQSEVSSAVAPHLTSTISLPSDESGFESAKPADVDTKRVSHLSSSTSSPSHSPSSSSGAVSLDQHGYQALADDDGAHESPRSLGQSRHASPVQSKSLLCEEGSASASHSAATSEVGEDASHYATSEDADTPSVVNHTNGELDYTKGDPLKDVFPNDANTWAQIKYSHECQDDIATDSPSEEVIQTALGLGISSTSMLHSRPIPPSASSSLDPFEFDDEARDALNSPVGPPEDDVKEVSEMLKASTVPAHFGLSSPINLGESSARSSKASQLVPDDDTTTDAVRVNPEVPPSRAASRASTALSMTSSSPRSTTTVDPAMIALPESDSNLSLSTVPASMSAKSLTSLSSQPSLSELDETLTAPPKVTNRDARLPLDWADQLSAMGHLRSRGNSDAAQDREWDSGASAPTEQLPQLLSQLHHLPPSRASLASLYAQSVRSRSSSVEMMDNLDEIERALAELSPRALKSSLRDDTEGGASLAALLGQSGALGSLPGYDKDSLLEQVASDTPRATPSDDGRIQRPSEQGSQVQGNELSEQSSNLNDSGIQENTALATSSSSKSLDSHSSGYMAPPLPLKIRTDRSVPSSPGVALERGEHIVLADDTPLPNMGTPTTSSDPARQVTSPGADSLASTAIPYDAPSIAGSPQQRVTFAPEAQGDDQPNTPTGKQGMSSKFTAGLKLKGWSGKSSQKEQAAPSLPLNGKESSSPEPSKEPAKSPLPGLKGFKWWQKDGSQAANDSVHKAATEISLPASPSTPHQADNPVSILQKPNPPFSQTARIPRKSSLASLAATARSQDTLSPNLQNVCSVPLPAVSSSGSSTPHFSGGEYPSPPTHTSLPSPPPRPLRLPSFMPSYPPQFVVDDEDRAESTPPLTRNDSSTTQSTSAGVSPRVMAQNGMASSMSLPVLGDPASSTAADYYSQRTPEMGGNSTGVFLGHEGRGEGHTTSAPVTPASAIPSLVPSSGRYGKPLKANPAKANFRLSADSDLSKMMKHMQAIEFGEEPTAPREQGHEHPARKTPTRGNFGLGLGLPGIRKVTR